MAFAPAGGWAPGDVSYKDLLDFQSAMYDLVQTAADAESIVAFADGRRRATQYITTNFEHIPGRAARPQIRGAAGCDGVPSLISHARRHGWSLDAEEITCPVRLVWGTLDRLLPWPSAAARYRDDWLPHADWVELKALATAPSSTLPSRPLSSSSA